MASGKKKKTTKIPESINRDLVCGDETLRKEIRATNLALH